MPIRDMEGPPESVDVEGESPWLERPETGSARLARIDTWLAANPPLLGALPEARRHAEPREPKTGDPPAAGRLPPVSDETATAASGSHGSLPRIGGECPDEPSR